MKKTLKFDTPFADPACVGDTISLKHGLYTFTAQIEDDSDGDGRYPNSTGADDVTREQREALRSLDGGDWFYGGISVKASYNGVPLWDNVLTSIWGLEVNFPGSDNSHLTSAANDLLAKAADAAKAERSKLVGLLTQVNYEN